MTGAGHAAGSRTPAAHPQPLPPFAATYRLQMRGGMTLGGARELVPYLDRLGVSHLYASPILRARPGSTHGYDVTDPTRLDPELGNEEELRLLSGALHERGMGLLLDVVPNHMAATQENPYWWDVLTHGRASRYARWFDIDWNAPEEELRGRVLLPVLGAPLRTVLERGEIALVMEGDTPVVAYHEHRFPLDPRTLPRGTGAVTASRYGGDAAGRSRLRRLLDRQPYRLAYWRRAAAEINYRRFFNINELVGLRVEDGEVFDATHRLVLAWVAEGVVDGLRIDHVDGLRDPAGYLRRLRQAVDARRPSGASGRFPIVVEKILSVEEPLRASWPVEGTTGYEVLNDLEGVLFDSEGYDRIEARYRSLLDFDRRGVDFGSVALAGKRRVLRGVLAADVQRLIALLRPVARGQPHTAALRPEALERAVIEVMAHLPVYRTYVEATGWTPGAGPPANAEDRALVEGAVRAAGAAAARGAGRAADGGALELLREVLLLEGAGTMPAARLRPRMRFVARFQQVSPPAAAKGVEDTALYLYHPLSSRNEVGSDPARPLATAVEVLHQANEIRAREWPRAMVCVSTHDTKRGADTRARLDVLSEIPDEWWRAATRWRRLNAPLRRRARRREAPDVNTEYLLFQALLGIWPVGAPTADGAERVRLPDAAALQRMEERMQEYAVKAVREGKSRSSWLRPDEEFEGALRDYINAALDPVRSGAFLAGVDALARRIAHAGWWNSLSRTLLQLTVPGVPDSYQGDELWEHTLVDPDNRRPVDFRQRAALLEELESAWHAPTADRAPLARSLLDTPWDGRVKLFLTWRALAARREWPALLRHGGYLPLEGNGSGAAHLVTFARTADDGGAAIVMAPRLPLTLSGGAPPLGEEAWGETVVRLPPGVRSDRGWRCALTGRMVHAEQSGALLPVASAIRDLPCALLVALEGS